jgi:hypothetical protein
MSALMRCFNRELPNSVGTDDSVHWLGVLMHPSADFLDLIYECSEQVLLRFQD